MIRILLVVRNNNVDIVCVSAGFHTKASHCDEVIVITSGYATWFTAGGAIRIAHYDVIDDVITRKL